MSDDGEMDEFTCDSELRGKKRGHRRLSFPQAQALFPVSRALHGAIDACSRPMQTAPLLRKIRDEVGYHYCDATAARHDWLKLLGLAAGAQLISVVIQCYQNETFYWRSDPLVDWDILRQQPDVCVLVVSTGSTGRRICGVGTAASNHLQGETAFNFGVMLRRSAILGAIGAARPTACCMGRSILTFFFLRMDAN